MINAGKFIPIKKANLLLDRFKKIHYFKPKLKELIEKESTASKEVKEYHKKDYNTFFFDKGLVQRFFDKTHPHYNEKFEKANYFVVFQAAHDADDGTIKENEPTVILAACTIEKKRQSEDEEEFVVLGDEEDATTEHPPTTTQFELRSAGRKVNF